MTPADWIILAAAVAVVAGSRRLEDPQKEGKDRVRRLRLRRLSPRGELRRKARRQIRYRSITIARPSARPKGGRFVKWR